MRNLTMLILLSGSGCAIAQPAHALTFPDRGRAAVVDAAHVLPDAAREALNRKVAAWDNATGHQLAVVTVPNLQGADVKDYGYQLGRAWGLGDKQRNDGVILLLAMAEHKVRIEVGYGLEPVLTDALTSQILADRVVPRLREGDVPTALTDGADAIMAAATSGPADLAKPASAAAAVHHGPSLAAALALIAALFAAVGGWVWWWIARARWNEREREVERHEREIAAARERIETHREKVARLIREPVRPRAERTAFVSTPGYVAPAPTFTPSPSYSSPPPGDTPSPSYSSDSGSSSSSDSSSGFDSGGGSFGGGGSDSSW